MALIKCPECAKEVSDKAETCPHCGYRLKAKPTTYYSNRASNIVERDHNMKHIGGIIAGVFSIIVGIVFFFLCSTYEAQRYVEIRVTYIIGGLVLILAGIGAIIYSAYRLNNY